MNAKKAGIALGLVLAAFLTLLVQTEALVRLGQWLRALSLSSSAGNAGAWCIVLVLAALPALGLLWRGRSGWDWLLLLAALQILTGLYFLVNPTLIHSYILNAFSEQGQIWSFAAAGSIGSTLLAWAVLRGLERLEKTVLLGRTLAALLDSAACLFLCLSGWSHAAGLYDKISGVIAGNTAVPDQLYTTYFFLVMLTLADMFPTLLGCLVLLWGGDLARAMDADPFGGDTVALAEKLSRWCAKIAAVSVLICVTGNAMQLLFFSSLYHFTALISFPVTTVLLAAALGMLCRYIRQAKAVSDDNESII